MHFSSPGSHPPFRTILWYTTIMSGQKTRNPKLEPEKPEPEPEKPEAEKPEV